MNVEIERKFLVSLKSFMKVSVGASGFHSIIQGYIFDTENGILRIRKDNNRYILTIKNKSETLTRKEIEVEVGNITGEALFSMCGKTLTKTRYDILFEDKTWEVDVFGGALKGLIIAEIELRSENEEITIPSWVSEEVTYDKRYQNSNLINSSLEDLKDNNECIE